MEAITFKQASAIIVEWKSELNIKSVWWIERVFFWFAINLVFAMIMSLIEEEIAKEEFRNKYKTIIKINCLGWKSHEYHER